MYSVFFEKLLFQSVAGESAISFLSRISANFTHSRSGLSDFKNQLLLIAAIVIILLILILCANIKINKKKRYIPHDSVDDVSKVRDILQWALAQRSKLDVQANLRNGDRVADMCDITDVHGTNSLIIESHNISESHGSLVGNVIQGFFRITHKKEVLYYSFEAPIIKTFSNGSMLKIEIRMPESLSRQQKRAFLRIVPPKHYVTGVGVWVVSEGGENPESIAALGKPALTYVPRKIEQVSLLNLSAGGLRLGIPYEEQKRVGKGIKKASRVIVLFDLVTSAKQGSKIRFWVSTRLQNFYLEYGTNNLEVGLQFMDQGYPSAENSKLLEWQQLPRDGEIEALGSWCMQYHLDLYREKERANLEEI